MKQGVNYLVLLSSLMLFLFSCKKEDIHSNQLNSSPIVYDSVVSKAKDFFDKNILAANLKFNGTPNLRQNLKKEPVWDKAYIAIGRKKEILVIPLKFEKDLTFYSSDSLQKLSLSKHSKLLIYEDDHNNTKAEVVTYISDNNTIDDDLVGFSGVVIVEDWAGNNIHKYRFKKEQSFKTKKKVTQSTQKLNSVDSYNSTTTECIRIHWYLCSVDPNTGNPYDCVYQYTDQIGCGSMNEGLEPPSDGGGYYTDYDEVEYIRRATFDNIVFIIPQGNGGGVCKTTQIMYGRFFKNHPEKDYIKECYFVRTDVYSNTLGATSGIYDYTPLTITKKIVRISVTGNIKYPNGVSISFENSTDVNMGDLIWTL